MEFDSKNNAQAALEQGGEFNGHIFRIAWTKHKRSVSLFLLYVLWIVVV